MTLLVALLLAGTPASTSTLERVAQDVSKNLVAAGFDGPVGVYVEGSPAPMSRAVGSVVMGALAKEKLAPVPVTARDATEAERLARELGLRSLVRLTVALEAPKLVVRGDALSTWVNFWSGETPTRTGPASAIATSVDADLEALTLAGGPAAPVSARPLELNVGVVAKLPGVPAALTLADVDGDKKAEVLVLVGDAVLTLGADGKPKGRAELSLASTTRPTREPFGLVAFANGHLVAWSSRREKPESFGWQGGWRSSGPAEALVLGPITLTPRPGFTSFGRELAWAGKAVSWPEPVQQLALFGALALGVSPTGTAAVARGVAPSGQVSGVGSGSTLADLDGDGAPEIIATTSRSVGDADEVRVVALGAFESAQSRGGQLAEITAAWQRKIEGRAVVAATGDLDGDGVDEVVLGTWLNDGTGELLVLRRSP